MMRMPVRLLLVIALAGLGCASMDESRHSPETLRYRCLTKAHQTVRGSGVSDKVYQKLVREVYLRCIDSYGVTDAPAS